MPLWYKIRTWLPLFHFELELPFISIYTELMSHTRGCICQEFDYICFHVQIYKWKFTINLYEKARRKKLRNSKSRS